MGREIKMVPIDFEWPLHEPWKGFVNPHYVAVKCDQCKGSGGSKQANLYKDQWYGNAHFEPASTGSVPFDPKNPQIREMVKRKINFDEKTLAFYFQMFGAKSEDEVIAYECERLCEIYNSEWCHHLCQADVDALIAEGRLAMNFTHSLTKTKGWQLRKDGYTPTAAEVNLWSIHGMGHDSINQWVCVKARCQRNGEPSRCPKCLGDGEIWPSEEAKRICDEWEKEEPPSGPAYQVWETVSEGSPISPPMVDPKELAAWMVDNNTSSVSKDTTLEQWVEFITNVKWAPSLVIMGGKVMDGVAAVTNNKD